MTLSLITFVRLIASILLPVIVSVVIYVLDKKTKFGKIRYIPKQIIIGILFGLVAISATEYGVPLDGAVLNVRSASPLSAGLIFGWPAGLIAGFIGGIERYLTPTGDFTRIACTFGTIIAGIVAALVRRFMLDNKRPSWFYGLVVGLVTEVIHMLMVFLNNSGDIQRAYQIVEICALPMIISNGISVMLALFCVSYISKRNGTLIFESGKENISQIFQRWLFIFVILAFFVTTFSASAFQKSMAKAIAIDTIKSNLQDIEKDIQDAADRKLIDYSKFLSNELSSDASKETLKEIVKENNLVEITFIDKTGLVINSSKESGRVCISLKNLDNEGSVIENQNGAKNIKYVGIKNDDYFMQIGFNPEYAEQQIEEQIHHVAQYRHIGKNGFVVICNSEGKIVSDKFKEREQEIKSDFKLYYGEFISALLRDIPSVIVPVQRINENPYFQQFAIDNSMKYSNQEWLNIASGNSLARFFFFCEGAQSKLKGTKTELLIAEMGDLTGIVNGLKFIIGLQTGVNEVKADIKEIRDYFESPPGLYQFLDKPHSNLIFDAIVNQLIYPLHFNPEKNARYVYKAKTRDMYTDVSVYDECRYIYEWIPGIHQVKSAFDNVSWQHVFRFCIDGLIRTRIDFNNEFFYQGSVVQHESGEFEKSRLCDRISPRDM